MRPKGEGLVGCGPQALQDSTEPALFSRKGALKLPVELQLLGQVLDEDIQAPRIAGVGRRRGRFISCCLEPLLASAFSGSRPMQLDLPSLRI